MSPEAVFRIVQRRAEPGFIDLLREADVDFADPGFEAVIAEVLADEPVLIGRWATYSADQRWTPSAYVEGTETGWYDAGKQHVCVHPDEAAVVADFIRRSAAWLARRDVITVKG